ncbi:MAG: VWA domain-containing protein [Pyrinomonadaceae bacterium]
MFSKFTVLLIITVIFGFNAVVFAQSGRRVKSPAPTAAPQTANNSDDNEPDFSESAPAKTLPIFRSTRSEKNRKQSDNKTAAQPSTLPDNTVSNNAGADAGDDEVLKIETNLITLPVTVYDRNGIYIPNLRRTDFKIYEDGKEQEVAYFGNVDKPFTVVLLIDVSPSTQYKIEEIQRAAMAFVNQLKPEDNVMVIEFDSRVHVLTEVTNNRQQVYQAISKTGFGDGTSLYDAVEMSIRKRLNKIEGKKAIVLFTDGVDTTSRRADFESTLADAQESDALIFPIYYNTYLDLVGIGRGGVMSTPPSLGLPGGIGGGIGGGGAGARAQISAEYARGRTYLEYLAQATGGRVYRPESTPGGLESAFEGIAEELRSQYSIGYYPSSAGGQGERKQIKVRVQRQGVVVRTRDSYIVGAAATQAQPAK